MFCDALLVMKNGKIIASGSPDEILTEDLLCSVFGVRCKIEISPHHGNKHIHFL